MTHTENQPASVDSTMVFSRRCGRDQEVVVNFGIHTGRDVTHAEVERLARSLLEAHDTVEIVSEHRFEIGLEAEGTVHQVRLLLPNQTEEHSSVMRTVSNWVRECAGERSTPIV